MNKLILRPTVNLSNVPKKISFIRFFSFKELKKSIACNFFQFQNLFKTFQTCYESFTVQPTK